MLKFESEDQSFIYKYEEATLNSVALARAHPLISLGRALFLAPIITGTLRVEANREVDRKIGETLLKWAHELLIRGMRECYDYGTAFWEIRPSHREYGVWAPKVKNLAYHLTDVTEDGLRNGSAELSWENGAWAAYDAPIGSPWGRGVLPGAVAPYEEYVTAVGNWDRYLAKTAGSHWVLKYPIGQTNWLNPDTGAVELTDNSVIADSILSRMRSSSRVSIPIRSDTQETRAQMRTDNSAGDLWKLEILTDHGNVGSSFQERERAAQVNCVRATLVPERSATEGQGSSSKGDSSNAASQGSMILDLFSVDIMSYMNSETGPLATVYRMNDRDFRRNCRLVCSPADRADLNYARQLAMAAINRAGDISEIFDFEEMSEAADLPFRLKQPSSAPRTGGNPIAMASNPQALQKQIESQQGGSPPPTGGSPPPTGENSGQ